MIAWLLPLVSFAVICIGYSIPQLLGIRIRYGTQKYAAYIAVFAIGFGCLLSMIALFGCWLPTNRLPASEEHAAASHPEAAATGKPHYQLALLQVEEHERPALENSNAAPTYLSGDWYTLGQFGKLKITIGYYINSLTLLMFCVVTLIATCVHIYSIGYMHDELHDYSDHEIHLENGQPLHRRGRFHRFFQYLSLFSFSMLGICIAGNLAMVFVFWELVGICSYFLIGFYIERHSATTAGNKAFIVNRVGDFGMLIGLMAIWTTLGTFSFGDTIDANGKVVEQGIFSQLREPSRNYELAPADGMIAFEARDKIAELVRSGGDQAAVSNLIAQLRADTNAHWGYWTLLIAGVGVFCGCMGKSAQFPLHVWLPDAMEGPTPVSALVHSATMVAAGVFLVGRVYPIFSPEALLVIAIIGCITLFLAATIAITAVDIKRVLAYSTVSQLGYMMLALGLGGWVAGLVSPDYARILQRPPVPLQRLGDSRRPHERHAPNGRPAPQDAHHRLHDARRLPRDRRHRHPVLVRLQRLPLERLDHRTIAELCPGQRPPLVHAIVCRHPAGGCRAHVVLHVPAVVHDVRRQTARSPPLRSRPRIAALDGLGVAVHVGVRRWRRLVIG